MVNCVWIGIEKTSLESCAMVNYCYQVFDNRIPNSISKGCKSDFGSNECETFTLPFTNTSIFGDNFGVVWYQYNETSSESFAKCSGAYEFPLSTCEKEHLFVESACFPASDERFKCIAGPLPNETQNSQDLYCFIYKEFFFFSILN
jgi:hypothetical protein